MYFLSTPFSPNIKHIMYYFNATLIINEHFVKYSLVYCTLGYVGADAGVSWIVGRELLLQNVARKRCLWHPTGKCGNFIDLYGK